MNEEDRKLWTERIEDYRSSGLTTVKWAENNNVSIDITLINSIKKRNKKSTRKPTKI